MDIDQKLKLFSSKVDQFIKSSNSCDAYNILERAVFARDDFNELITEKHNFNNDQALLFDHTRRRFEDSIYSYETECKCEKEIK